ncbi:MAG TPA: hypothetical protein VK537_02620 [Galbitalea sp.]|nr:hypothetical protein [Galbitalea sp.]
MMTQTEAEATAIARVSAVIAAALVLIAGAFAYVDLLQISDLALLCALASSIAAVTGRPSRGVRWLCPAVIAAAMVTVVVAGFVQS